MQNYKFPLREKKKKATQILKDYKNIPKIEQMFCSIDKTMIMHFFFSIQIFRICINVVVFLKGFINESTCK